MKQRETYKVVIDALAQERMDNKCCPFCGKPRKDWPKNRVNRMDWHCCCSTCTAMFWNTQTKTYDWSSVRRAALKRDNYTCRKCGTRKGPMDADHILPIALGGAEFDINNVQTLCKPCHKVKTKIDAGDIAAQRAIEKHQDITPHC